VKDPNELQGRTENNRVVNFAGGKELIGTLVNTRVTESYNYSLRGELVD
jgi:tRNA-2-methylthio-N6-dimethylallyladenosine synthase